MKSTLFNLSMVVSQLLLFSVDALAEQQPAQPQGWLFDPVIHNDYGISVSGWAQASIADSNHHGQLTPATGLRRHNGFTLDQAGIMVEKKLNSNLISRVGPVPGEMPADFNWGFNISMLYGADAFFMRTYGLDEDWSTNQVGNFRSSDYYVALSQVYLEFYFPYFGGSNLMAGLFHSPLAREIGFPLPSPMPTEFYTRAYSFMHAPGKHAGLLWNSYIINQPDRAKLSYELGVVNGYNTLQHVDDNWNVIANLRWRSKDFATAIDFENLYGNNANDSIAKCGCGSPYPTDSALAQDNSLKRYQSYLIVSHQLDEKNTVVAEATYGRQQKSLIADIYNQPPIGIPATGGTDASWSGINFIYKHQFNDNLNTALRAEYFDTDGANVMLPYGGAYKALTANVAWFPVSWIRLRPEVRYDWYSGNARPYGARGTDNYAPPLVNGRYDDQLSYSLDLSLFF
ncbi:outer membrane beta-barrel protein [Acinetobacter sp. WZC-1]|uniref:outer membrane beta-barrel protein n=1 Tax=Acinetobacter sp. WZC-1 TaxID=3459034 RepID=UPI00403DC974